MNRISLLILVITFLIGCQTSKTNNETHKLSELLSQKSKVLLKLKGQSFRDLNDNGKLDIYEDVNQSIETRLVDLLSQMSLEEKAGMMFINGAPVSEDGMPEGKKGLKGFLAKNAFGYREYEFS